LPYWVWLTAYGVVVFILGHIAARAVGENEYLASQAAFTVGASLITVALVLFSHAFDGWLDGPAAQYIPILLDSRSNTHEGAGRRPELFHRRFNGWRFRIFGIGDKNALILVVGLVVVAGLTTVVLSGLPFRALWLNAVALLLFAGVLAIGGHAAFVVIQLLRMLTELGSVSISVPFGRIPHPTLDALLRYVAWAAVCTLVGYGVLLAAVVGGPYGLSVPMASWLTALLLFPLAMVGWSALQVHRLLRRLKDLHLDTANGLVQRALTGARSRPGATELEAVERALALQKSVQHVPTWPFVPSAAVAAIAVLTSAVAQLALVLSRR
jgi:hypothetical protein